MKYTLAVLGGLVILVLTSCWASVQLLALPEASTTQSSATQQIIESEMIKTNTTEGAETVELDLIKYQAVAGEPVSQALLIYDLTNQQLVFEKNSQLARPIASLTKIMTALLAVERLNLDQSVTIQPATIALMRQYQASMAGFVAGEIASVRDLLHGLLLASGGEAAYELANTVGGDQENFANLMNQRAQELAMTQTHFVNSTGLDNEAQYSTTADLQKLLSVALQNPTFRQIFTTRQYRASSLNRELLIDSTLFSKLDSDRVSNFEFLGGKTGTTWQAGLCLVSLVRRENHELLIITLGAPLDRLANPTPWHIDDLHKILNNLS